MSSNDTVGKLRMETELRAEILQGAIPRSNRMNILKTAEPVAEGMRTRPYWECDLGSSRWLWVDGVEARWAIE